MFFGNIIKLLCLTFKVGPVVGPWPYLARPWRRRCILYVTLNDHNYQLYESSCTWLGWSRGRPKWRGRDLGTPRAMTTVLHSEKKFVPRDDKIVFPQFWSRFRTAVGSEFTRSYAAAGRYDIKKKK